MNWVLIIILLAGGTSGGVSAHHVDGFTRASCEAARSAIIAQEAYELRSGLRSAHGVRAVCVAR